MRFFTYVLFSFFMFAASARAQTTDELKAIEDYLNTIKTLEARFIQTASSGTSAEGTIRIAKPNKVHMEYDSPVDVLIVGDGNYIVYNDKELDQVTHIDYNEIPATLILGNNIRIDGNKIKVTHFYKDAGITTLTLEYVGKSNIGPITLTFDNKPELELKQWKIIDPQNIEVVVSLYDMKKDIDLPESLFKFKDIRKSPLKYKGK